MTYPDHVCAVCGGQQLHRAGRGWVCEWRDHVAEIKRLTAEIKRLTAEVKMLRGVGCSEDGSGQAG